LGDVDDSWYTPDPEDRRVCSRHVEDLFVADLLLQATEDGDTCSFCGEQDGAPLDELLEAVEVGLLLHYETASNAGVGWEGGWTSATMDTWDVVAELVSDGGFDDEVAEALPPLFHDEAWVHRGDPFLPPGGMLTAGWRRFVEHVKHRSRFLLAPDDGSSEEALDSGWAPGQMLEKLAKVVDEFCVTQWPAGKLVYRARAFEDTPFDHAHELAAPPPEKARQGRMNPAGISMFYGATDPQTAAAEVFDGRRYAAVAAFETLRPLDIVDLADLPTASVFNPDDAQRVHLLGFLAGFAREISRPIARDDRVHFEYTPTQIFTEYMRFRVPLPEAPVDGIAFRSAQWQDGLNVVLFTGPDGCLGDHQRVADELRDEDQILRLVDEGYDVYEYAAPASQFLRPFRFAQG
jgi:hypothetical protein